MFEPIIIKLDYSPRDERLSKQVKSVASRLGKRIGSGLIDRPNIGNNRRALGSGRVDIPTGGVRGYKKPTGNRRDIDGDGWSDEGTTNPIWVGLSSGQDRSRPIIQTQRPRPKINLNNQKIKERKKIRQKIKYGESSLDGKLINRKSGPKWLDGLSNEQISNILVPDSYQTYSQMLADGFGVDKQAVEKYLESRWGVGKPWLEIDYSENSIKELRQALKSALDESPIFSWAVRNYGSPTYTVMTRKSAGTYNNRDAVKPLYDALKKMYPDAPMEPQFAASNHLDFEMVTFNPLNVVDKKSWRTNEPISSTFEKSKLPSDSDTVIDRSISGTILHEWAHWYHSEILLANIESSESKKRSPKSLINPQDSDFAEKVRIALEYNSDNGNMNLHSTKKPLEDSPNEPRTITSYGHVSRKEMFAEGMLAYMHPNEQLKLKAINKKLRQDIETILAGDKGVDAWKDSKANIRREKNILSSGRKNRKLTKLSSGSKTEELEKPAYPRHPSYGPFLDGADDVFADVKNWKEFKEIYDNLEINFFDYETTGLVSDEFQQSSGNGAPVQFGVTKTKGGKEIGRLNIFMNPGEELGDWSRENLKNKDGEPLTDEWLSSQTSIADAHKKLIEFVGPDAIFGVQNAVFDKTVLEDALTSSGIEWRPKGWVDTKVVSDLVIPKWTKENQDAPWTTDRKTGEKIPSSSLKALTEYLNIDLGKKHHTADADAAATSELMSKIIDKAIEKNWSNDIFDKNWRDQKTRDKLENHQQKIIDFEQQKNNWISETSPKKSTVPKETEKKEFGFGRLSSGTTSYKGRHESPDTSSGAPLHNLANGAIYPEDIYGPNGANLYGGGFPDLAQKAVAIFRKLRNKPDSELTIYRAVPRGKNIKEGDWVTILPEYAKIHGDSWLKDDYEIVTKKVKAKELFNEGNSLLEFGYHSKLSSGKNDGAPTYKGKVWKDRKNELDGPVWPFSYQAKQYPKDGPSGISYFKGVVDESTWVDCLLFRDDSGKLIGILNHYPFALVDPDDPRIVEKRGNINIFIDPKHKNKGIATKLVDEAVSRYSVDLRRQRYSDEGANFINKYVRKLPENKNKPKPSSGATEITPAERKKIADKQLSVKLSIPDIEAIGNWNGYLFKDINNYLRNNNFGNQELAEGVVKAFERISVPVPADLFLWRGIRASQGEAKAYRVGDTLQDDGFQSATFKKRIATQFNSPRDIDDEWEAVVFEINVKKGTKVVDIGSLVEELDIASDAEDEILLQNGTQYKVTKIERNINQNKWAGIDDTSFKGEKITVITVDVIKNSDKDSRLSSGSQPRMNLSDEEKREIIAIASQRTDDFSKSVVAQFRRNGKLSDRQWNALNRATLRRSRLSSGKNTDTEPQFLPIENLTAARDPNTDTNLQTPVNWEARGTRYATRRGRGIKVGQEIVAPLELQLAIVEDYKDIKKTLAFIAKKHNVTIDYVSLLARQFNLPYRKNIRQNLTGVQQANIVEAIKAGIPNKEIRKKFNITKKQLARLKYISETARERELRLSDKKIRREKTNEEIIKLFNEGLRITDIARRTETDFNYVGDLLLANTETREKLIARRDGSDLIPQVRELFKNGLNMLEIRNKLRKDMKTIKKIINEDEELSKLQQERIRKRQNLQSIATELREFLLSGESYDAAMKKFNLSRRQINKFVQTDRKKTKEQGETADRPRLPDRRSTRIVLPYKTERDNEIVKLYKQGTSRAELMQMFRITPSRLSQILKKQLLAELSSG